MAAPPRPRIGQFNPLQGRNSASLVGGAGFNSLAAGDKQYGLSGSLAPNVGPVNNRGGYAARDTKLAAQRAALENVRKGVI